VLDSASDDYDDDELVCLEW